MEWSEERTSRFCLPSGGAAEPPGFILRSACVSRVGSYPVLFKGHWRSWLARLYDTQEVTGSNPVWPIRICLLCTTDQLQLVGGVVFVRCHLRDELSELTVFRCQLLGAVRPLKPTARYFTGGVHFLPLGQVSLGSQPSCSRESASTSTTLQSARACSVICASTAWAEMLVIRSVSISSLRKSSGRLF